MATPSSQLESEARERRGKSPNILVEKAKSLVKLYLHYLRHKPLLTKCCSSSATAALGDAIAQWMDKSNAYSFRKTLAFALFGFFATGPITHNFYRWLNLSVPPGMKRGEVVKLLIERLIFAPPFLLLFFYVLPLLQGRGWAAAREAVTASYKAALVANWKFWTIFQYINMNFVPPQHQVLYTNILALFWNIYLSRKQR